MLLRSTHTSRLAHAPTVARLHHTDAVTVATRGIASLARFARTQQPQQHRPIVWLSTASRLTHNTTLLRRAMSASPSPATTGASRGVFILLEGLDRSGKSSQCVQLAQALNQAQSDSAVQMRFPDRTTAIGQMIDAYLKQSAEIDDHAIHLLFSANRWEKHSAMVSALQAGQHLVVDRYAYSGIAFTSSKVGVPGLGLDWTTTPDRGLLAPDLVIFLDITNEDAAKRGGFGEERYEKKEIQERVREVFNKLRLQSTTATEEGSTGASFGAGVEWTVVNAGQTQEAVHAEILALSKKAIEKSANAPVRFL